MMNVPIPSEFEAFVRHAVSSGRYEDPAALVADAIRLLERREELRGKVDAGLRQLDRGEYTEYDENSLDRFLADIEAEAERLRATRKTVP
jgi:antitoxin ParD1/3/4